MAAADREACALLADALAGALATGFLEAGALAFAAGLTTVLLFAFGAGAADRAEVLAPEVAFVTGFGLAVPGGFTLAALFFGVLLALTVGLVLTLGLGLAAGVALTGAGLADVEVFATACVLTAEAVLAGGLLFTGWADLTGAGFRDGVATTGLRAIERSGGEGAFTSGRDSARFEAGAAALVGAGAAGAGATVWASAEGEAAEPLAGGRGPRSPTRTGSTMSCVSSAWRSGVSDVSRHVKATTSLVSECLSKRTIAV